MVLRGKWICNPATIKGADKDAKIYVGRSTTVHNLLLCAHTLCMNYATKTFLLVSCSIQSNHLLCFVHGQGQKSEQKHTTKKFAGIDNHSSLLTMTQWMSSHTQTSSQFISSVRTDLQSSSSKCKTRVKSFSSTVLYPWRSSVVKVPSSNIWRQQELLC